MFREKYICRSNNGAGKYIPLEPINSVVFLTFDGQIVSFMYAIPNRNYACHSEDNSLEHWGIKYIQTNFNYQGKGYGYRVALFGIKNMIEKGTQKVKYTIT